MYDTTVQQKIAQSKKQLTDDLVRLNHLQIQSEVFTPGLLWERLFNPAMELIQGVKTDFPAVNWSISENTYIQNMTFNMGITIDSGGIVITQSVFDDFLAIYADSDTFMDSHKLYHVKQYQLGKFKLTVTIVFYIPEYTRRTLFELGKIKVNTSSHESLTCEVFYPDTPF